MINVEMAKKSKQSLRARLALTTALATVAFSYGNRNAVYAGACAGGGGVYSCSGVANAGSDVTQSIISGGSLTVTTDPSFGINTYVSGGSAVVVSGTGGVSFTDNNSSAITAEETGVLGINDTSGNLSITTTGTVISDIGQGISAINQDSGTGNITINAVDVTGGGLRGISASNAGTGSTSVTATGTVTSGTAMGIFVSNDGTTLTINANNVTGDTIGIRSINDGSGDTTINVTGNVVGGSGAGDDGISALGGVSTHSIINLNSGASVGAGSGDAIRNDEGTSAVTVNSGAAVTGTIKLGSGNDTLTFDGGDFSGVTNFDGGDDTDTLTFKGVTGTVAGGDVNNFESVVVDTGSDVTFSGTLSTGQFTATNTGSGAMKVTSTGSIESTAGRGIDAFNDIGGTDLIISANDVTGAQRGIHARNAGTGDVTVTATGDVTGTLFQGVYVRNLAAGGDVSVDAHNVTGTFDGIAARSLSDGTISVAATGHVEGGYGGNNFDGITAYNIDGNGKGITVTVNSVTGGKDAIDVRQVGGTGNLAVEATGLLTATNQHGVFINNTGAGNVSVTVASVDANFDGVSANNTNGTLTVNASGTLNSATRHGVRADSESGGTTQVISVNNAYGNQSGVFTNHQGTGSSTINVTGSVTGNLQAAIDTNTGSGGMTIINLNSGADISSNSGNAITNDDGNSTLTGNAGSSVTGLISLGGGTDNVIVDGADFSGVTQIDGGAGTDSLTIRNVTASFAGGDIVNVESIKVETGANISISGTATADVTVDGGSLSAGNSPGALNIMGNLDLGIGSKTLVELGGLLAGINYDQIDVEDNLSTGATEGIATLDDGTIFDVDLFGGFTASLGDMFDVLIADTISVSDINNVLFDFSDATLGSGLVWNYSIVDDGGHDTLRLEVAADSDPTVPEPSSMLLFGFGMFGLWRIRRQSKTT
jgi:hypothetical protein